VQKNVAVPVIRAVIAPNTLGKGRLPWGAS
jgi:hypothetical protein